MIEKASDELVEFFDTVKETTSIPHWVEFEVMVDDAQKELYKVVKTNKIVESLTDGVNFVVVINEEIFDQLPEEYKEIALLESIAGISVSETDRISNEKPNFNTYRGMLERFGHEKIITLHESIKSLFDAKKNDEEKK